MDGWGSGSGGGMPRAERITAVISAAGTNSFIYQDDADGLTTQIIAIDRIGRRTIYQWDPRGIAIITPDGTRTYRERTFIDKDNLRLARTARVTRDNRLAALYDYTPRGKPLAEARCAKGVWRSSAYQYSAAGDLAGTVDEFGRVTPASPFKKGGDAPGAAGDLSAAAQVSSVQSQGSVNAARVEYVTNALGYVSIYSYDDADNLISLEDPLGRVTHYLYDTNQWLTAIILPNGSVSSNVYDALGRVIETISPDGTRIGTDYDNLDRPVRTIFLSESAASGQRNINGHPYTETMYGCCGVLASIDRAGRMTSYDYDPAGRLIRVTDAELNTVSYAYDDRDNLVALTDGNGNATSFDYDDFYLFYQSNRYLSAIEFPGGNRRTFSYAEIPRTVTWSNYWRQDLRTTELSSAHAYYENEQLAGWAIDGGQNAAVDFMTDTGTWTRARYLEPVFVPGSRWAAPYITYYYTWRNEKPVLAVRSHDTPWLVSDAWQPTNYNNSVYIEVFWGTSVAVTDENGAQKEYRYDMNGALIAVNPDAGDTSARNLYYNRFLDSNLRRIAFGSSCGDSISFLYDALGQLLYESNYYSSIPALQYSTLYSYDPVGNRTGLLFQSSILPSIQSSTAYSYDNLDRLTNISGSGVSAAYSFADPDGNLTNKSYNNGVYTEYAYDARGHLTGLTNRTQFAILDAYQYEYDTATMISAITRCTGGAPASATVAFTYDKTYQFTSEIGRYLTNAAGGSLATATVSNQYAYDDAGNRISSVGAGSVPRIWLHTADNQLTTICWNAASITLRGRLDNAWTADWVKVKHQMAIHWINATVRCERGQAVRWQARDVPVSTTLPASFNVQAHTPDGQTISETVSYSKINGSPGSIAYTYDANGNRTRKTRATGNSTLETWYDYDTDNQLTRIREWSNSIAQYDYQYAYDPFGRRISASEDGVTRHFAYDGLDCITELDSSANVKKWYLRGNGLGGGIGDIIAEVSPTTTNYYCYNHRGDVALRTSANGAVVDRKEYSAFGAPVICDLAPATRSLAFSSKEYDTKSGLSYYGFRYYDADSGRWISKDVFIENMDALYLFCQNSPVSLIDLMGRDASSISYSSPWSVLASLVTRIAHGDGQEHYCHDYSECLGNCISHHDPMNSVGKVALTYLGGTLPKAWLDVPNTHPYVTTILSYLSIGRGTAASGANTARLVGRTFSPIFVTYGLYMATVEAACAGACAGDANLY